MPALENKKVYQDFSGGLVDRFSPIILKENQSAVLTNHIVNERGLLEKAEGYIKDHSPFPNDTDSFIRMLLNLKIGTSVDVLLMAAQDDANTHASLKVDYKKTVGDGTSSYIGHTTGTANFTNASTAVAGTGTSWLSHLKAGDKIKATAHADSVYARISTVNTNTSITLTANYTGATTGGAVAYIARILTHKDNLPRAIGFNGYAVITNGVNTPMRYNNTTLDLITDADTPKGKYIEAHKARVFIASTSGNPSRLFWSATNNEASWDASSNEDIFPQDNGNIISIKSFANSLIVFKSNGGIYQVVGSFDQSAVGEASEIRKLDSFEYIGIIAERSPVVHNGFLYFFSETGIYRIDQRLTIEKVSYGIDNLADSVNFALGPTTSKTYTHDSTTQWNTGTHSATRTTTTGNLESIVDKITISDALKNASTSLGVGQASVAIDSSNVVYLAYLDSSNRKRIKYKSYAENGTVTAENVLLETETIMNLSLAVAPNGNVGIGYVRDASPDILKFVERVSGTWGSAVTVASGSDNVKECSLRYRTDNDPRMAYIRTNTVGSSSETVYAKRTSGTWTTSVITTAIDPSTVKIDLILNGSDNPRICYYKPALSTINHSLSDNDGTSWTDASLAITSLQALSRPQIAYNAAGNSIVYYGDNGSVKKRNFTTSTTSTIDSTTDRVMGGGIAADKDYAFMFGSTGTEKLVYEDSLTVSNSVTGTAHTASTIYPGSRGFDINSNKVCAMITWGASASELLVRRMAPRAIWTSAENSDSTLSTWGTYEVGDQVSNSATITHEIALNTISPPTSYNTIVAGQVISTDAIKIFIKNKITFLLGDFAKPEIGSIVDNYTGAGIDSKQVVGTSFKNELYFAISGTGDTANSKVILSDIEDKFTVIEYPVSSFEMFKNKLYAGKSTKGDLIQLRVGANFDGSAYTSDYQSKEDFLDSIELEKDIYKIYVLYEVKSLGTIDFSYRLDNFKYPSGASWTVKTIDQTKDGIYEVDVMNRARSIQMRAQNDELDAQTGIIAFVIVSGFLNIR